MSTTKTPALLVALLCAVAPAQANPADRARTLLSDPKGIAGPGCAAGAFRDGKTLFVTGAGAADIAAGTPIDGDTLFYAASIAKQFTSLAAAKLIEQGKLSLDDDVRKYIPELPEYAAPVTVRMLMLHTAGIRDTWEIAGLAGFRSASDIDKATALQLLVRQRGTNFTPGTGWSYSNGGYVLLAEIIARVAGMSFADYARKSILQPLGMKRSFFMDDAKPAGANIAHGYVPAGDGFAVRDNYPYFSGSGGLLISMNDLARYEHDIAVGGKIWTSAVRAIMLTPGKLTNGAPALFENTTLGYGPGLMIGRRNGQFFVQHSGVMEGFRTMFERLPERKLAVAVLCNRGDWSAQGKADEIVEAIEGDILADDPAPATTSIAGRYVSDELPATYDITLSGDELTARISSPFVGDEGSTHVFRRNGDGTFSAQRMFGAGGATLQFDKNGQGFTVNSHRTHGFRFRRSR
jgi:CubicO group peptidase (beta-lactamase class C family)